MNGSRVLTLHPYLLNGCCWVFDDERTCIVAEPFVEGMSEMISRLVAVRRIPAAAAGFTMSFSDRPFPGHDVVLDWQEPGHAGGNWYAGDVCGERMEGWLCPALFCYFRQAPRRIFVRCDPLPDGVSPRWTPPSGTVTRRFVEPPSRNS